MTRETLDLDGVRMVRGDQVVEIILNEQDRRNPMSPTIMKGLVAAADLVEAAADDIACVILTGAGTVFSSGGDLPYNDANLQGEVFRQRSFLENLYRPFLRILDLPVPTLCALNGHAVGGGLALAMLCDMRIMAEDARLIPAFGAMGFFPGLGLTYSLERLLGPTKALEVFYMGTPIAAQEALALGLCSKVTTKEDLMDEARHMAATIASNSHFVNRMLKSAIMSGYRGELRQRLERDILAQVLTSVSEDYKERRAAIARERSTK